MRKLAHIAAAVVSTAALAVMLSPSAAGADASAPAASAAGVSASAPVVLFYHFMNFNSDLSLGTAGVGAVQKTYVQRELDELWSATLPAPTRGYQTFENLNRKCLGIAGASRAQGARAVAWTCNNHRDQQWKAIVISQPPAVYEFQNLNSGLCLSIAGASRRSGAAVIQRRCLRQLDQRWFLNR
jgi:hypothetical protein